MNLNITANKNFSIFLSKFQFLQLLNFFLSSTLTPESYLQHAQKLNYSFHFLTSYSPSTQFLAFWSIWGFWKWSQMIPHIPKHWFFHQNHVSIMLRSWVRISLLEVLLDLLQPLHPVLGLQVDVRLLKMVTNDSPYPKILVLSPEPCL